MTLAAWFHDLSPFAIRLTGGFGLRWYGISYALGFLIAWLVLRRLSRTGFSRIPADRVGDAVLYAVMGVVVGGRLGYVLFYQPVLLRTFTSDPPWWGLLAINQGGMASHGGILGVITAAFVVARGFKTPAGQRVGRAPVRHILDCFALVTPFGLMLGRLANFVNGELLGRVAAAPGLPAPWWAVKYPQEISEEHTTRLAGNAPPVHTEAQWADLMRIVNEFRPRGGDFDTAYHRLMDAVQRHDAALIARLEPLISSRYPSQLAQAAAEGVGVGLVVWLAARRPRLPGVVGCWFMISYGVLRVLTEMVRLPDAHLAHPRVLGLSRGQWLSAGMVAVGVVALAWIIRRGGEKMGGWARTPAQP